MPIPDRLQYVEIDNFSPGIWSTSGRVITSGGVKAPQAAADPTNTFRCYALASGALAPLPGLAASYTLPAWDIAANVNNSGAFYITAITSFSLAVSTIASAPPEQLIVGVQYDFNNGGTPQPRLRVSKLDLWNTVPGLNVTPASTTLYTFNSNPADLSTNIWAAQSTAISRANATDPTQPGQPYVAMDNRLGSGSGLGANNQILVFPDVANPTGNTMIAKWTGHRGPVIAHQGRLVQLQTALYNTGSAVSITTNEQVSFTDPANSYPAGFGTQNEVFVGEFPMGYGAWGSQSVGELFLVKHQGGAVYVTGDIANPTVTRLPGVTSTGGVESQSASTVAGFFYPTATAGMWAWNGGNTSRKISLQLEDSFWQVPNWTATLPGNIPGSPNFGIQCKSEEWNQWVIISNNWVYDTATSAWWRLDDPSVRTYAMMSRGWNDRYMFMAVNQYTGAANTAIYTYDRTIPATSYRWQSHPISVSTLRMIDVRKVGVVAQGTGTVKISLVDYGGNVLSQQTATLTQTVPQRFDMSTTARGYNIAVRVDAVGSGTNPAPLLYHLSLGYHDTTQAGLS